MVLCSRNSLRSILSVLALTGAAGTSFGVPAHAADPVGVWLVADQSARIRIEPCPNGLWGVIDWERQPGIDSKNPDPAKRGRPMLGVPILVGMKPAKPNEWEGQVYNPKDGGLYFARLTLPQADTLRLDGCIMGGLICDGENWTRVAEQGPATTGANVPSRAHARSVCPQAQPPQPRR
jgi:uncharacterized protein (DUF2147 family)